MTLDDIARAATGRHRFRAVMVMAFAALALVLAMVGVFGILAYSVQQSVRDFGVRRALGATTTDVLRLVLVNALRVVGTGAAIGLVLAAMSGRLIETLLFGVKPLDPRRSRWSRSCSPSPRRCPSPGRRGARPASTPPRRCGTGEYSLV